jgi:hypothetical protein
MGKAGQRHRQKLSKRLKELARQDTRIFLKEWQKRLDSWVDEIRRRGQHLRNEDQSDERQAWVFEVLEQAERLLTLCGPEVGRLVGAYTRDILIHECCKAVAFAIDPRMYSLSKKYHLMYRLMDLNTRRKTL